MLLCSMLVFSCVEKPEIDDPGTGTEKEDPTPGPQPEDPTYPEVRSFDVKAGDSFELSFNSSIAWTASADVKWIVLSTTSGEPGETSVKCDITADKPDFGKESKGNITVKVADKDFVFPVTRAAMERSFRILSADKEVTSLNFDANEGISQIELSVEANFYWDLDITRNWPVWIEKRGITDGQKGEDGIYRNTFTLKLNEAELDGNDKSGALTFTDIDDESFTSELPVSYTAVVIPETPFEIRCEFGNDIHVNKMGFFKNADGSLSSTMMVLEFQVITENADELIVITPTGVKNGEGASYIQAENNNKFVTVTKSGTTAEEGVAYTAVVQPGLLENASPKSPCDMAYILVLPKKIYEPYEKYFQANDPYYQMAFTWMRIDNYLFEYMYDSEGNQVSDSNGLVSIHKDFLRKYMLRIYVDAD